MKQEHAYIILSVAIVGMFALAIYTTVPRLPPKDTTLAEAYACGTLYGVATSMSHLPWIFPEAAILKEEKMCVIYRENAQSQGYVPR